MSKILGIVHGCKECPNRHYYSAGTYECAMVRKALPHDATIPAWCPLPDQPADKDAERYRWLKMTSSPDAQREIMRTPWGKWDAFIDAAIAAEQKGGA